MKENAHWIFKPAIPRIFMVYDDYGYEDFSDPRLGRTGGGIIPMSPAEEIDRDGEIAHGFVKGG